MSKISDKLSSRLQEIEAISKHKRKTIIKTDELKHHPDSVRKVFNPEKLRELANSIKRFGMIEPIPIDINNFITQGNRRNIALKLAGRKELKMIELDEEVDVIKYKNTVDVRIRQLLSDVHRQRLTVLERAEAFKKIIDKKINGIETKYQLARFLCISDNLLCRTMSILNASSETMKLVKDGKISQEKVATVLYRLKERDENKRIELESFIIQEIIQHKMDVVQAGNLVAEMNDPETAHKHIIQHIRMFKGYLNNINDRQKRMFKLTEFQKGKINKELNDLKDLIEDITKKASIVIEEYEYGKIYGKV